MRIFTSKIYRRILLLGMLFISLQLVIFSVWQVNMKDFIFPPFNIHSYPSAVNLVSVVQQIRRGEYPRAPQLYDNYDNYSISNAAFCFPENKKIQLIMVIKSSIHSRERRDMLRETWANENCWKSSWKIKRLFFIENSENLTLRASIYSEFMEHADIVQFEDFRNTSALKSYILFQWLRENCLNAEYVMIVEESIDIIPTNIINYIKSQKFQHGLYAGELTFPVRIKLRYENSYFPSSVYNWESYSPYIQTNLLILSAGVAEEIAIGMQFTQYLHIDEIYMAIIVGKLDIPTTTNIDVIYRDINVPEDFLHQTHPSFLKRDACQQPVVNIPHLPDNATKFPYPLNVNMTMLLNALEQNKRIDIKPINQPNFLYSIQNDKKCQPFNRSIDLLLIIKCRADDFELRRAIRETWGNESCWDDWTVRRLFSLGLHTNENNHKVNREAKLHKDIIRQNFLDKYHNNTYKTMMSLDWIAKYCPNTNLIILVDADIYLHAKNIKTQITSLNPYRRRNLYSGLYLPSSAIYRSVKSKWYVSVKEIPWPRYPPFIMGGAVFLTYNNVKKMATIMPYMHYFRIDDVFLGLMANKLGIQATRMPQITLVNPSRINNYFLAQHFFKPNKIRTYWTQLESAKKFCH